MKIRFILLATLLVAGHPVWALECSPAERVVHLLTLNDRDGKVQRWGTPRNYADICEAGDGDSPAWRLEGFPGNYKSPEAAAAQLEKIYAATRVFTKVEWDQALAFAERAMREGTQNGSLFVEESEKK